ncbi:MAG: NnrS family protein [Rhodanobacter sp.]|nr:MAG: NnrS family protein [Rhodanobacter sp.]TAL98455.1 MAG: NnrS family protein [Rhodanobacter sp.]TAM38659.1 MAG: NnrS family protein [Rhodanobacter sp.]TAN23684.1 MAG: NnrS family protein [Rhodanobacter sp.]
MSEQPSADTTPLPLADISRLLASTPHRPLFLAGTIVVMLNMAWWAVELTWMRFGLAGWPQPSIPPVYGHAMLIQYGLFPLFMFGFLMTTFPRWLGCPDLPRTRFLPVAGCIFGGYVLANVGLLDLAWLLKLGMALMLVGYGVGVWTLAGVLRASVAERRGHARSALTALCLGMLGLAIFLAYLFGAPAECALLAINIGTFGLLLPIYFTVMHRMLPFFTGNMVKGYPVIRPDWSMPVVWVLLLVHLVLAWRNEIGWLYLVDVPLALVFAWHALTWRPWQAMYPGILAVLHLAFAWLPVAFVLFAIQDVVYVTSGSFILGRAPLHALGIGFFGSMLVAMVTRVTQGHSGRPMQFGKVAWLCFVLLQVVALVRIRAELGGDVYLWLVIAAYGWLLAFLPWVLRSAWIYLTPRADGKPG